MIRVENLGMEKKKKNFCGWWKGVASSGEEAFQEEWQCEICGSKSGRGFGKGI